MMASKEKNMRAGIVTIVILIYLTVLFILEVMNDE